MSWHNASLQLAGLVGAVVAIVHGFAVQRLIVVPFATKASAGQPFSPVVQRLVPVLIHFSTFVWFAGGLALALATRLDPAARLSISLMVGATYLIRRAREFLGDAWRASGLDAAGDCFGADRVRRDRAVISAMILLRGL